MAKFKPSVSPTYSWEFYTSWGQEHLTAREMQAEYTKLYRTVNKRIETIQKSDLRESSVFGNVTKFKAWTKMTAEERASEFARLGITARSKVGTLTGLRDYRTSVIEKLRAGGYEYVTEKNLDRFIAIMSAYRDFVGNAKFKYAENLDFVEQVFKSKLENRGEFRQLFETLGGME